MVLSDLRQNLKTGSRHTSLYFTPDITLMSFDMIGNLYTNLYVSAGQLIKKDGTVVNPQDKISLGEELKIILNAPNQFGSSATSVIYQNNTVIGYFALTTENEVFYSYDPRYNDLLSVQVVPEIDWLLDSHKELKAFDFDGNIVNSYDLNQQPTNRLSDFNTVVLDYHRNMAQVFDVQNKLVAKTLSGNKPTSASSLYAQNRILQCTAIAFNGDSQICLYDQFFSKFLTLNLANVIGVYFFNNVLYAWAKDSKVLNTYTFNELVLVGQSTLQFDNFIQSVVGSSSLFVLNGNRLSDLANNTLLQIDNARNAVIESNNMYVTHGAKSYITQINLSDFSNTRINIPNAAFLDSICVQAGGRIYISDIEAKKIYARGQFNQDWELDFRAFGLVLGDQIYALDTYTNIPSKIDIDVLKYQIDATNFLNIQDVPLGSLGTTGNIRVLNTNRSLPVRLFPQQQNLKLQVNGVTVPNTYILNSNDVVTVVYDYDLPLPSMFVGIAIDQQVFELNLFLDDSRIVPLGFKFTPVINAVPDSNVLSNVITITALTNPVTVTLDKGSIILNGVDVGSTALISNNDEFGIKIKADSMFCTTKIANITIEDRFTSVFSVTTISELPDDSDLPRPQLSFETQYDKPLGSTVYSNELIFDTINFEPTEFTIPEIYNASFLVNGVNVGKKHLIKNNDAVRIVLDCSYNYDTAHFVPINSCYSVYGFTVYTIGDIMPDSFGFGTIQDANIKDYLVSDLAYFTGIGNNVKVPVIIPYGVLLRHNGQYVTYESLKDWRNMPLKDQVVILTMSNNDTLQLEGYPRPIQGIYNRIPLYVGGRAGYWNINTHSVADTKQIDLKLDQIQAYNLIYDDLTKDYFISVVKDVEVVHRKTAEIETNSTKVTSGKILNLEDFKTISLAASNKKVDNLLTINVLNRLLTVDHDLPLYTYNSVVQIERDLDVFENKSNVSTFEHIKDLYAVTPNQFYLYRDLNASTIKSVAHQFDQDLNAYHVKNISYYFPSADLVYWNRNTQYNAEILNSNYLDAFTINYDFINVQTEYVVISFDYKPFQLFDLTDSTVFKYGENPTISNLFIWQNVPWVTSEIEEIYYHRQPDIDVEDRVYEKFAGSDLIYYDPVYEWKTHKFVTFDPDYTVLDINSNINLDFLNAVSYASNSISYEPDYVALASGNSLQFELFSTVFGTSAKEFDLVVSSVFTSNSLIVDNELETTLTKSTSVVFEYVIADHTDRNEVVQIVKYDTVNQHRDYIRSPLPNTLHPGYFADEQAAKSDSVRYGYQLAQIQSFYVEEKGWAWNRIIPCSNLCDPRDCPPSGYIHGG
jgi:hypothetical protein